ncbi:prolyl oligopeptidase family serine peptidase [Candidatus Woesebacteria bacterium]|nr:MAG: prolyl oligopeptidase family serine peptidase [Candidatus Woesebacteria bacterium]
MKINYIILFINILATLFLLYLYLVNNSKTSLDTKVVSVETPLNKYTIENLSHVKLNNYDIVATTTIENDNYTSLIFSFEFNPDFDSTDTKITTGLINIPKSQGEVNKFPLIIMIRGYVDPGNYETGTGTKNAGYYFAEHGFITLAPDFLGYAGSDINATDIFESRFQTYTTVLALISKLGDPQFMKLINNTWDQKNIFIWAHSNGGQIALTVLTAQGYTFPTSLWAPVTKPFPYSILYYTDESEDGGKFIRRKLSDFEHLYNTDLFSFTNYLDNLHAPLMIHQGTNDNAVPKSWNDSFVINLNNLDKEVEYHTYPNANHNLQPFWDEVVEKDVMFFTSHLIDKDHLF